MNLLLIIDPQAHHYAELLQARNLDQLQIQTAVNSREAATAIGSAEIILAQPALVGPLLSEARRLCWLQSTFAGIEQLCRPESRRDYLLTGVKGIFGPLMSQYVFAYILAIERNLIQTHRHQLEKRWAPLPYRSLQELTIGIVGLGSIGREVARTAAHFGMRVLGLKRSTASIPELERLFTPDEKPAFLADLDYLVLTLPETPETIHFLDLDDFHLLPKRCRLISVGRGTNLNTEALVDGLRHGLLKGAVLDVFEQEPLPAEHPLWDMEEVYITPHNAADSFPEQVAAIFADNYVRYRAGQPLRHLVDFDRGY